MKNICVVETRRADGTKYVTAEWPVTADPLPGVRVTEYAFMEERTHLEYPVLGPRLVSIRQGGLV